MRLTAKTLSPEMIEFIIGQKVKWILAATNPLKLILIGSAASQTMTDASDVDLIAIYDNSENLKEINRSLLRARPKDDWPQDLLLYTEKSFEDSCKKGGGICWIASREGRILYEKPGRSQNEPQKSGKEIS